MRVVTNDPANRNLRLTVSASVEVVLALNPVHIRFAPFSRTVGVPDPVYARLTGRESATAKIIAVESQSEFVNVEFNPEGFDGDPSRQFKFSLRPGMDVGRFREQVTILTDSERMRSLRVFVIGEVVGTIAVSPRHLPFGTINPEQEVKRTITLQATSDAVSFKVLDVNSDVTELRTELITVEPGRQYQVEVTLPKGFDRRVMRGEVFIVTDVPDQKTIAVRVFGRVGPPTR